MKSFFTPTRNLVFAALAASSTIAIAADDHSHTEPDGEEVFEYEVGKFDFITGEGANIGGFIFPEIILDLTGGLFEPGTTAADLATTEHDPQNEAGVQAIEVHLDIDINGVITGGVSGSGFQGEDEWEAELEEAFLHYHLNDYVAVGGGQFLNTFGFQSDKHLHVWDFVNQNLVNSRILNEGEFITQGGEAIFNIPGLNSVATIGGGGVRTHAHDHGHGEEEFGHEDEHGHEEEIGGGHQPPFSPSPIPSTAHPTTPPQQPPFSPSPIPSTAHPTTPPQKQIPSSKPRTILNYRPDAFRLLLCRGMHISPPNNRTSAPAVGSGTKLA